jgi:hypothetical protein
MKKTLIVVIAVGAVLAALMLSLLRYEYNNGIVFDRLTGRGRPVNQTYGKSQYFSPSYTSIPGTAEGVKRAQEILSGEK